MQPDDTIISQTQKWIVDVVAGCNFCPFAIKEIKRNSIHYDVSDKNKQHILEKLSALFMLLDTNTEVETTFLIIPDGYKSFYEYLDLIEIAENFLASEKYTGMYQLASFHPLYIFQGSNEDDPSNYTNRSPFPMIHILREASLTKVIDSHPDIAGIPKRNIAFTKEKGLRFMQSLRNACMITSTNTSL